jgi:hypothetical protein
MGLLFSSLFSKLFGNKEVRVLILGLDNAGKTTILYKLYAPDRVIRTMPTIGFNVESVVYKNLKFSVWDLGVAICGSSPALTAPHCVHFCTDRWPDEHSAILAVLLCEHERDYICGG